MKKFIVLVALISIHSNACEIVLNKMSSDAKTYYLNNGETLSQSIITKLSTQCRVKAKVMSADQVTEIKIKQLQTRIEKLKNKKA